MIDKDDKMQLKDIDLLRKRGSRVQEVGCRKHGSAEPLVTPDTYSCFLERNSVRDPAVKNGVVVVTTTPNINTKRVEITFDKNTGYAELAAMKSYCEQRGITLNIRETKYNDQEELVYVSFEVDCGDGFKGAASAGTVALASEHVKFGFYRDYSPKAPSPFGTGSF